MANVAEIVCGDTTHIHSYSPIYFGLEHLLLPTHSVVQPQLCPPILNPFTTAIFLINQWLRLLHRTEAATSTDLAVGEDGMGVVSWETTRPH